MTDNKLQYISPELEIVIFDTTDFLFDSGEPGNTNDDMDWLGNMS